MNEDSSDGVENFHEVEPASINFHIGDAALSEPVGTLFLDPADGKLKFEGDMDKSAKIFFENHLKLMCDNYIKEKLKKEGKCQKKPQ